MKVSPSPRNSFVLKVLLSAVALIGFGLGQTAIAQTAQPADSAPDGSSAGPEATMPAQDIHQLVNFLDRDDSDAPSNITVNPPGGFPNVNSVVNFSGSFIGPDGVGGTKSFPFTMMGNDPLSGHTSEHSLRRSSLWI